jgi:hypothetical protein
LWGDWEPIISPADFCGEDMHVCTAQREASGEVRCARTSNISGPLGAHPPGQDHEFAEHSNGVQSVGDALDFSAVSNHRPALRLPASIQTKLELGRA